MSIKPKQMKNVLITGGTGLVGKALSKALTEKGYNVSVLTRNLKQNSDYKLFKWNPEELKIDNEAFKDLDYLVHLAGENLGSGRWTKSRKQKIINSRVASSNLLFNKIHELKVPLKAFISASAIGIYPAFTDSEEYYVEKDMYGTNFAAQVCIAWEKAADNFKNSGIRTVKIRTGLVQDVNDPALKKILKLAKFGILPVFGKGKQYYPWIHINDLVRIYVEAIENENFEDPFNAVAPELLTNIEYAKVIKSVRGEGKIFKIPAFILKLLFGEMSEIILKGTKIKSKLHNGGFKFEFPTLECAMEDLLE